MTDGQRNVVLVTYDSLRADHCGHLGYHRDTTPALDEMARDGVTFTNALSPASRTNPSMAGIFTGRPMVTRDRVANPENARGHLSRYQTVAERFRDRGYTTGAFCPNAYASRYYGFDEGFDHYEDFMFDNDLYQDLFDAHLSDSTLYTTIRNIRNLVRRQEAFKTWDTYIDDVTEWVDQQSEPFFLWIFALDTHFPHLVPRQYREWSSLPEMYYYNWRCNQLIDDLDPDVSDRELQKIIDIYDDSILFGDALLAELNDRLSQSDPVTVVHGDHGEAFCEHGPYGHFYPSLYEENVHVPMVVSGIDESARVEKPLSLLDLPEVVTRASQGEPISDMGEEYIIATDYDGRFDRDLTAVRTKQHKYMITRSDDGIRHECYDLSEGEQENLAGTDREGCKLLRQLAERRETHEAERLAIETAASNLGEDDNMKMPSGLRSTN